MKKIAIVTGSTRGLGWGTAQALADKGYELVLLARNEKVLSERVRELESAGHKSHMHVLDLSDFQSITKASIWLRKTFPEGIDLLVNNGGIFPEDDGGYDTGKVEVAMQTNALGPLQLTIALSDLLWKRKANVVNVSSGMGGLAEMKGGCPGYRLSKTALNAATRYLSEEWKAKGVRVNSVCPGWVRTEMGGPNARRSIPEGVASILWAALLDEKGPTGGFYRDGKALAW